MGVKQGPPSVSVELRHLVWDTRRRAQRLPSAAERIPLIRDAVISWVIHREVRCEGVGSGYIEIVVDDGKREVHFHFPLQKMLRSSSQAVVVRKSLDCRKFCTVAAVVEYRQQAESMRGSLTSRSGFLFPSVIECGNMIYVAFTPMPMTTNLQIYLRAAGGEDIKRYTLRSPGWRSGELQDGPYGDGHGVRGVTVRNRRTHRHIGLTASAAVAGVKPSRQTTFIEAGVLQLSANVARSYTACARNYRSRIY